MAKVSKLWHVFKLAPRSDNFRVLDELHTQYGDYVRTGPSEISISDPDAIQVLLGPGSKCTKAPWYDANYPVISLHTLRDKKAHDVRRRIWDRGFGAKALRDYEDRVFQYSKDLERQIKSRSDQVINATEWFHFYSFDVMADIAFGKSFEMIQTGKPHFAFDLLREGMRPLGVLGPVPWAFCVLTSIPGLGGGFKMFVNWCTEQVEKRKKIHRDVPDVMSWLIESSEKRAQSGIKQAGEEQALLHSDSRLIIVAGSDTTASTLTYTFYLLAQNAAHQHKLRDELAAIVEEDGSFSFKALQNADHLNGVINEALRLYPAVPSGLPRLTPPEGLTIRDTFIPGNTTVVAPFYTMGRLESCYENAAEFIPERWYSKPELVKNKKAFAPFSTGPFSCVGKQLALMELRMVVALLVSKFSVQFAPGEDGKRLLDNSKDFFTISIAELNLVFSPMER
ncbi:hypothetical protein N7468_007756 [Penicillium chermesinum]|uniref:Cytochrome P450 monooxygenase poxM n=1 Tax=Penicillium chermesinum TaxID=63820 RepID=A0A9W9NUM8_9EURO|nr:uncharacterized protein N7468_007756 [Penicillium chermesinum]KAJ5226531.1 hypothetical protein N7468_007756 [Penicillium chermesinum]